LPNRFLFDPCDFRTTESPINSTARRSIEPGGRPRRGFECDSTRLPRAHAIAWALVNDRIKLLAYRVFDPPKAQAATQPAASSNIPAAPNEKPNDDTKAIAARAFELYRQREHGESQQDQDWLEAERETHLEEAANKRPAA